MEGFGVKTRLEDGLLALSDLLQSGGGSCRPETEERLAGCAKDWEAAGLHTGAALLSRTAQILALRRHGGGGDPAELMEAAGKAARYTRLCLQKYALDAACARLCGEENKEESQCGN